MKFFEDHVISFVRALSSNTPSYSLRNLVLAVLFGAALGVAIEPAADVVGDLRTYGKDTGMVLPDMACLAIGLAVLPEIEQAKVMGVSKRQYMNYVTRNTNPAPEQKRMLAQFLYYLDQIWRAEDGGAAVVEQCFKRAEDATKKPSGIRRGAPESTI